MLVLLCSAALLSYGLAVTSQPPCCRDMLGSTTCNRLLRSNKNYFAERCNTEAEFRLIQCCTTCNKQDNVIAYDRIASSLVNEQCFDRYGPEFCGRYVNSTDVWAPMHWSCEGQNPHIAFRSCRKSCGFCDFERVHYSLDNALAACVVDREAWKERTRRPDFGPYPKGGSAFVVDRK
ncbi:hypothetical protein QR680_015307 [Steinernema hermaphroditum]|uniref:ShKT domain-containing protein n=1 Tax=Steinernema hermaphroditum TaxID=289476 RepID=A0AA39LK04_9BILA|nr:hypothetical protein QR680_015307 [Steinernema hermaphroditum]